MDVLTIILTIIVGGLCIYLYGTKNYNFFKKLGIPFVKPIPIFGNMAGLIFRTKSMVDSIDEVYNCNPEAKYVGFYEFGRPVIMLKDPELVKSIAIKNFDSFPNHKMFADTPAEPLLRKNLFALKDDEWRDMRSLLSPSFTSSKMKMMYKLVLQCAKDFADCLATQNPQPEEMDMKETFGRYTLDVIASSAFGLNVNSMRDRDNDFYRMSTKVTSISGLKMLKILFMNSCPWLAKILNVQFFDPEIIHFFMNVMKKTIATRDAEGIVRPDMIQLMMQARDRKEKSALTLEDMTSQAIVFFLGGFDAPSTTMSFAAQMLVLNPDIQRKLQAEIDQVIENSSGEISYEDLHAMKYLDAVISETLRMFPPGPVLDRIGPKSFTLPPPLPGLEPVTIEAGQTIALPCYSFHHDPRFFPDPEKFDPERFSDENKSSISPGTYFPFGIGPRICIANRFALMEVKLALFHLLARCNLVRSPKTSLSPKLSKNSFSMLLDGGFWLKIEPRS